jgi:hypothetical protein
MDSIEIPSRETGSKTSPYLQRDERRSLAQIASVVLPYPPSGSWRP